MGVLLLGGMVFARKDVLGFCKGSFYIPGRSFDVVDNIALRLVNPHGVCFVVDYRSARFHRFQRVHNGRQDFILDIN